MSTREHRPLRILHVSPYFEQAWAYGGIPRVVATLTATLAARGHQVAVCTTDAALADRRLRPPLGTLRLAPWREVTPSGVEVHVFPNVSNRGAYRLQAFLPLGMGDFLRRRARDFDVAHVHACRNLPGVLAARALGRAGVPFLLSPHGTAPRVERRFLLKRAFDRAFGRRDLNEAFCTLAVSQAEHRQLLSLGVPDSRIRVLPNPLLLQEFEPPADGGDFRRRLGPDRGPIVLFLGKLTPRKRLDVLAAAVSRLPRPDARLVVAGADMGYGRELRRLVASLGLADRTVFTGVLRGRERLDALAAADVVAYASRDEVFGLVAVEALLCGTPVVVADDSGCGEIVRRVGGGLVVPEGDPAELSAALTRILEAPEPWRRAAATAATAVRALCSPDSVCTALESIYEQAIAGTAGARTSGSEPAAVSHGAEGRREID